MWGFVFVWLDVFRDMCLICMFMGLWFRRYGVLYFYGWSMPTRKPPLANAWITPETERVRLARRRRRYGRPLRLLLVRTTTTNNNNNDDNKTNNDNNHNDKTNDNNDT